MKDNVSQIEEMMYPYLPKEEGLQKRVLESMNYSFLAGGKRLRPMLMLETYKAFGGKQTEKIAPFMAALEMIHTYSLIHDDLPAMDNDDYRRGRLTNHKQFDEATAILAGDGLLNLAFETMLAAAALEKDYGLKCSMINAAFYMSKCSGVYGMIGGQMADILGEGKKKLTKEELEFTYDNKTAKLLMAAMYVGAVLSQNATPKELEQIEEIARLTGRAFQVQDDILDKTSTMEKLGKPIGSDDSNNKFTYISLVGMEAAMKDQAEMTHKALELIDNLGCEAGVIKEIIEGLIKRTK